MPATSIRMSASSSTIRMSCAMNDHFRFLLRLTLRERSLRVALRQGGAAFHRVGRTRGEDQADLRPAIAAILEYQFARMVFHDLLDDGKPQPRPLGAGRDIRLGQGLPALPRQALAVVLDHQ